MKLEQYLLNSTSAYKNEIDIHLFDREFPNLTPEIINQTASKTHLYFELTKNTEGNVCMANNKELRPEFRQTFTPTNILDYIYAIVHSSKFNNAEKEDLENHFPLPKNAEIFWDLVRLGSKIKQIHSFQNEDIYYYQKLAIALSETERLIMEIDKVLTVN